MNQSSIVHEKSSTHLVTTSDTVCGVGFAVSLVKERTEGTLLRLQIAPIPGFHILAGKAVASSVGVVVMLVMMLILGVVLGIQLASPAMLLLAVVCIAVGFVGLMMLMSVLGRTEQAVAGVAWAAIVLMCMFGGGMMPLVFMPPFMITVSHLSPVKWAILALEGAIWRGFSFTEMLLPCCILLGMGVVSFTLGAAMFSRQKT